MRHNNYMKKASNLDKKVADKPTKEWSCKLLTGGQSPFGNPYPVKEFLEAAANKAKAKIVS